MDYTQKILSYSYSQYIINNLWIFDIAFLAAFSLCILHLKLYSHQLVSSLIMLIFGIALNLINFEYDVTLIYKLLLSFFIGACYNLAIVLAKYGMDYRFCSPFEVTFYEGFFGLIMNIIFLIIASNTPLDKDFKYNKLLKITEYEGKKYLDHFQSYIDKIDFKEVILFLITLIGRVLFNLFSHLTIKHFTSIHVVFLLIMGEFQLSYEGKTHWEVAITICVFVGVFFMLLVFCEIIQVNACGMEKNTRKNILERERLAQIDDSRESKDSKEIWDGLELSSNSDRESSSINYSGDYL